ncbi:MAG: hypothetical protein BGO95_00955 [Micrococcales bacterium 73-13]|nr:MAG: hypothetical protein BGO95_00955 [Micrococcales bacterium 73-13]
MRRTLAAVAALAAALALLTGCVAPPPIEPAPVPPGELPEPAPPLGLDELAAWSGVAQLNAGSLCSATLIDTAVPSGPAYLLTNGHCVGDVGRPAQQTTLGMPWGGTAEFLRADGGLDGTLVVDVVELAYSTMRLTDTAVVRLDRTLGELEAFGLRPVPIADAEPRSGDVVVNVGIPVQDLASDDWVLRRGQCGLERQHTLIEFHWLWQHVWANDCPGIIQGSSGSGLFRVGDDGAPAAVVAMINTTTGGSTVANGGLCFLNRPCEVAQDGTVTMLEDRSYAQSVAGVGRCFDPVTGVFALADACPLPDSNVWSESSGGIFRGGGLPSSTGTTPSASLVGRVAGTVRTALTELGDGTACFDPETYQGAAPIQVPAGGDSWELVGTRVDVDLPEVEGHYTLCAVLGDDYRSAAAVLFEVDRTPPILPAGATVYDIGDAKSIRPHLDPPEISTVRFAWGPPDSDVCDDPSSFQDFFIVPLTLHDEDLPAVYCVYGLDAAGNATPVKRIDVPVR